jgi:hypothetical protein
MVAGKLRGRVIGDWPGGERVVSVVVRASGRVGKVVEEFVRVLKVQFPPGDAALPWTP